MRKLTCHCEQSFMVDLPEVVTINSQNNILTQITEGSFLSCICPSCNAELNMELRTLIKWPEKNTDILLLPEIERIDFLSGKTDVPQNCQLVIGYPELADRITVLSANLDPLVVETIKYYLAVKALEKNNESKLLIVFDSVIETSDLKFHIHGIKENEVAVMKVPYAIYQSIQNDIKEKKDQELYNAIIHSQYISYQNILIEDSLDD